MDLWHAPRLDGDSDTPLPGGGPRHGDRALPRCPYAERGIDDDAVRACPGFTPVGLTFQGLGAGESLGRRESCAHLDVQPSRRGFVSACACPGGLPAGAAELARRLPRMLRTQAVR